jgi:catechol 2,3-dioxygenase-like lactoylglutathione lyase family enzyme
MRPRIDVLTLGVADLERSLAFYRALGLESGGVIGTEFVGDEATPGGAAAMFELQNGLILSLYGRDDLAKDANATFDAPGRGEFSVGHLVASREDVDAVLAQAEAAGATVTDEPHDRPWGIYSGYFRDPDGHLWEVIWNPRAESSEK